MKIRHQEYRSAILDHLVTTGITHYDPDIRELSATALGKVTSIDGGSLADDLIHQQVRNSLYPKLGSEMLTPLLI
jgi:hypothetical protein